MGHIFNFFQGCGYDKSGDLYLNVITKAHLCSLYQSLFCAILTMESENAPVKLVVMTTKSPKK